MWEQVVTNTSVIWILMVLVGMVGVLAKVINQITARQMVKAAGNMSKSTHKLMKLVRAKYEHACMVHDTVENVGAFVEKYVYEYRKLGLRTHTWRQLQIQSVWFTAVLTTLGVVGHYISHGLCEHMYQYVALGAAQAILLFVVIQFSDESYKVQAAKNYMVDYLENVCAHRYRKVSIHEKEELDVIATKNLKEEAQMPINIEGEPRKVKQEDHSALREKAIRQILEEFLA